MDVTPAQLVDNIESLTTFPDVAHRVTEVLDDDTSGAAEIGEVIEPDPALSAALLRIANSASFGGGRSIDSITGAIKIVGLRSVRDLTYAIASSSAFQGIPNELLSVEDFWRHSLYCASAAQQLSIQTARCRGMSLFTFGLLHDIGQLILFNQCPERSRTVLQNHVHADNKRSICECERAVFGFDHTEVGDALAQRWEFPDTLRLAIRYHHSSDAVGKKGDAAALVGVANSLAVLAELQSDNLDDAPLVEQSVRREFDLDDALLLNISRQARSEAEALLHLFVT